MEIVAIAGLRGASAPGASERDSVWIYTKHIKPVFCTIKLYAKWTIERSRGYENPFFPRWERMNSEYARGVNLNFW